MTGKELLETVCQMGFANTLAHNEPYFYRAVNLSLSRICRSFPLWGKLSLCPQAGEEYDIAELAEDFLGFSASPIFGEASSERKSGTLFLYEGRDYTIKGSSVFFFKSFPAVCVHYLRRAAELTEDNMHKPIDIQSAAESLLPLLTASYLWLDDRGELATHYLTLYRTEASELLRNLHHHGSVQIGVTNGWDGA